MQITIVVGNPKPASRTLTVAEELVNALAGGDRPRRVIDLAEHTAELFSWPSETMAELNAAVAESDLVLLATPTYKASYTGLLKAFLDRYPAGGLQSVVAIPVFTGADLQHSMAPSNTLLPLLTELGATVVDGGLYFNMMNFDKHEEIIAEYAVDYRARLSRLGGLSRELG